MRERSWRLGALGWFALVACAFLLVPVLAFARPSGSVLLPLADHTVPTGEVWRVWEPMRGQDGSGLCSGPVVWFESGRLVGGDVLSFFPGLCWDDGYTQFLPDPELSFRAVVVSYESSEPPDPAASGAAFSWSSPAAVLQLFLWGAVPLVGFWGYSMGARE